MIGSGADLHVGEVRRHACRLLHYDWCISVAGISVAELAVVVESPGVGIAVAAHSQGEVIGT